MVGQPCSYITAEVRLKKGQRMSPGNMYNLQLSLELPDSVENRQVGREMRENNELLNNLSTTAL